jgi:hypothetical protein
LKYTQSTIFHSLSVFILGTLCLLFSVTVQAQESKKERKLRYEESPQYQDGKFINNVPTPMDFSFKDYRIMMGKTIKGPREGQLPEKAFPMNREWENLDEMWWSWLGHSTVYMQIQGQKILIDPIYSERSSPFQWVGPKRFHKVPLVTDSIPDPNVLRWPGLLMLSPIQKTA